MLIKRDEYLKKLISSIGNNRIKIITGIRRCGKSVLLFNLFYDYLINNGIDDSQIIKIKLDIREHIKYRDPDNLINFVKEKININTSKKYFLFIDEVQLTIKKESEVKGVYIDIFDILNQLLDFKNLDIYVTGSNSTMLSSDINTKFKDRGCQIRLHPLSYKEYKESSPLGNLDDYILYGGFPHLIQLESENEKKQYLEDLINLVYVSDIINRHNVRKDSEVLLSLLDILALQIGSLTNPLKLANSYRSIVQKKITSDSITNYLNYFQESFLINKVKRFNITRNEAIESPSKFFFEDIGLRNAQLSFMNQEIAHIIENVVFNYLNSLGYSINVINIEQYQENKIGNTNTKIHEVDFCIKAHDIKSYIQVTYDINVDNIEREILPLKLIKDSFKKIIVTKNKIKPYHDENGFYYVDLEDFLLDESILK